MKVYISKTINSARMFVKPEDSVTLNEPTFLVNHREAIEATIVFSPNTKSMVTISYQKNCLVNLFPHITLNKHVIKADLPISTNTMSLFWISWAVTD